MSLLDPGVSDQGSEPSDNAPQASSPGTANP